MIQLPQDFRELFQLLNSKKIEYLVIGGYAVALYGYPRATGDIDIWIATSEINAKKIVEALIEFGFNLPELKEELFLMRDKNIRMGNPPLRIEFLTSIDGVEFAECYKNKKKVFIDNVEIDFISLEDLKKNKKASARYQDLADLENLDK
ncbi:MAG: nucleotidyltransferase [Chlamydiota bacterium]|nr:nucleotidyltransferase [Chlamydiota bacterium]